ncbi:Histone deacetylase [Bertholletia excelsa]
MEKAVQDVVQPFSELRVGVQSNGEVKLASAPWRPELSKIDVWYSSYGSNMCEERFLCYIQGGQVEGMKKPCPGSMDKSQPKGMLWKTVPHRLFFGRDSTRTWGPGGAAFLHPISNSQEKAYMCMYRITLEQFNDVLLQENGTNYEITSPAFGLSDLDYVCKNGEVCVDMFKSQWYSNVVYMGDEDAVPILTMTCPRSDVENFASGKLPLRPPAKAYENILVRGLVEGRQLSEEEARAYIKEASTRPIVI